MAEAALGTGTYYSYPRQLKIFVEILIREETDYRFKIIVYMHRKFQMFGFPLFQRGRSVTRPKISVKNLRKKPNLINDLTLKKLGTLFTLLFTFRKGGNSNI